MDFRAVSCRGFCKLYRLRRIDRPSEVINFNKLYIKLEESGAEEGRRAHLVVELGGLGVDCYVFERASERVWELCEDQWVLRRSQLHTFSKTIGIAGIGFHVLQTLANELYSSAQRSG